MHWKHIIFLVFLAIGIIFAVMNYFTKDNSTGSEVPLTRMQVGRATVQVEMVDSMQSMYLGLGGRQSLPEDQGMLFVHSKPGTYQYVMRGMLIPLDFVFINGNKVVDIAEAVPAAYTGTIKGATEYDRVLEVNAGWVKKHEVKLGDEVRME